MRLIQNFQEFSIRSRITLRPVRTRKNFAIYFETIRRGRTVIHQRLLVRPESSWDNTGRCSSRLARKGDEPSFLRWFNLTRTETNRLEWTWMLSWKYSNFHYYFCRLSWIYSSLWLFTKRIMNFSILSIGNMRITIQAVTVSPLVMVY